MLKPVIEYTIGKSRYEKGYIVWRESTTVRGICYRNVFRGNYKECEAEIKRLKELEK